MDTKDIYLLVYLVIAAIIYLFLILGYIYDFGVSAKKNNPEEGYDSGEVLLVGAIFSVLWPAVLIVGCYLELKNVIEQTIEQKRLSIAKRREQHHLLDKKLHENFHENKPDC